MHHGGIKSRIGGPNVIMLRMPPGAEQQGDGEITADRVYFQALTGHSGIFLSLDFFMTHELRARFMDRKHRNTL